MTLAYKVIRHAKMSVGVAQGYYYGKDNGGITIKSNLDWKSQFLKN